MASASFCTVSGYGSRAPLRGPGMTREPFPSPCGEGQGGRAAFPLTHNPGLSGDEPGR